MDEEKGKYLDELVPGQPFPPSIFVAKNVRINSKDSGPKVSLYLSDCTDRRKAKLWSATPAQQTLLLQSSLIRVTGDVAGGRDQYTGEITIQSFEAVDPLPKDLSPYREPLPASHEATRQRFDRLLNSVGNPFLKTLLNDIFRPKTCRRFENAVAAGSHHHAFRGGLLQHTVEVAELCLQTCGTLPFLRRDLLVSAALLHDIGKLVEMDQGLRAGDFTALGVLEGHVHHGAFRVQQAVSEVEGFPSGLKQALVHLLLSHHGCAEWGSPKCPAIPEAAVLAQCDQISAHATEFHEAAKEAVPGQLSVWRGDRSIFVGDLGLDDLDLGSGATPLTTEAVPAETAAPQPQDTNRFATASVRLPIRGLVAAGDPGQSSEEEEEAREVVPPPGGADYLLRVTGDSMVGAGILEGDLLFIKQAQTARHGETVIAHVPASGNVVKRYEETVAGISLVSENPIYGPIPITEETRIQGKVVGLLREF